MTKILDAEELKQKMMYQGKDGNVYYKLTKDRQSVINTGELAFMKIVFKPGSKEFKYNGRLITNYFMTVVPLTADFDKKDFIEGEQLSIGITKTDYDFLNKYIEPTRGKILTCTGRQYKNAKGFDVLGKKWGQVTREIYFKVKDSVDKAVDSVTPVVSDDDFIE